MERHRCKLCHRKFANGRALGGHMRSHMMNLPIPPKPPQSRPSDETESEEVEESSSSSSSSDSEEDIEEDDDDMMEKGSLLYKLRENPKKSIKLADLDHHLPQVEAAGSSSVTLQDRESETESCRNPTRLRSKRQCRSRKQFDYNHNHNHNPTVVVAARSRSQAPSSDYNEAEPVSSISEVTSEEDVAFCLMMLSRDKWISSTCHGRDFGAKSSMDDIGTDSNYNTCSTPQFTKKSRGGGGGGSRYKCETCNKVFKSYQALGGHRASHKKIRVAAQAQAFCHDSHNDNNNNDDNSDQNKNKNENENEIKISKSTNYAVEQKKIHECPVCLRVFGSGQALGGHKRSHVIAGSSGIDNNNQISNGVAQSSMEIMSENIDHNNSTNINLIIDLNLPAPVDDEEEISQIALSAVSDAHL